MKNLLAKISRRERLYLIVGAAALFVGLVMYPSIKKATSFREEQMEMLSDELALLEDLYALDFDSFAIEDEYEALLDALDSADNLLFPPIENRILTQTAMIKLLNQLGPDLELETTSGRSTVGDAANQMNLQVRGQGRYPELLKFMYRLETYRPLLLVNSFTLTERKTRRRMSRPQENSEPRLDLRMSIQIICQDGGEK